MCHQNPPSDRTCVICRRPLVGRSDKVFCDIKCKNKYHVEARKTQRTAASETNRVLARNYIILAGLMVEGSKTAVISKLALTRAGFNFQYITEANQENGIIKFGVYDLSWKFIRKNMVAIEAYPNRTAVSPFVFERWRRVYKPIHEYITIRADYKRPSTES